MYVFINSSDKTSNVENNSITIENALQERIDSADFSLSGFKPNDLDDVKIYEGFPIVNSSINSVSLKKYYWETIQNNIFRIGDIVDVNAPNRIEGTVSAISEDEDTVLGYTFLEVDTTATGSTVALSADGVSYTTVTDGGSITIPSTYEPEISVRTNITANRIYLSSNDYNASSSKDGSLKQSVVYNAPDSGNTTLASSGGLLINIDSATGDIASTTTNTWLENNSALGLRNIITAGASNEADTAVTRTGAKTLKLSTTNATGLTTVAMLHEGLVSPITGTIEIGFVVKPSTKYKLSCWVKTNNVAASSTLLRFVRERNASGTIVGSNTDTNSLSGTNDWTLLTCTKTTVATAVYSSIFLIGAAVTGNTGDAWFDINSMTLEEVVEPVANSLTSSSPSLVSLQAVGSTYNIDQSQTDSTTTQGLSDGYTANTAYRFTPTKSKLTSVSIYLQKVGSPTDNIIVQIQGNTSSRPNGTILATASLVASSISATKTLYTFNVPCNLTIGTDYHITVGRSGTVDVVNYINVYRTNVDNASLRGSIFNGVSWIFWARQIYFTQQYYKPTTNFKASQNNSTVSISSDEDGFLNGSVYNLVTGTATFTESFGTFYLLQYTISGSDLIAKLQLPGFGLSSSFTCDKTLNYSSDGITYGASFPTGFSKVWVKILAYSGFASFSYSIQFSTSGINVLRNYPTNVNRFREYGTQLGSQTTTATYRVSKYGFPAIEWLPTSSTKKNGNTKLTFSQNFTSIPTIGNIAGRKKFAGNIIEIQDSNNTLLSNVQFNVKALDYTRVFDKKLLNDSYEDKDARYIINDFCNTTINLNQELDEFEYANNTALQASWIESGTGGNPTLDTSNYREGTQSAIFPWTGSGTGTFTGTISAVDVSMFTGVSSGTPTKGRLGFWYKTADYTKVTSVTVRVGSDSSNYISSTFTPTSNDFTFYDFLLSGGTKVGTPVWTAIDYIAFVIVETGTSSINIDGIRILENDFFRHYPYVQESVIISDFRINRVKPTEIMQRLADSLAWYWFVDYDKYIHLFSETTQTAPIEITQTSNNFSNLTISADTSRLVNRQVIRADDETSTSTYSQVIQGDGIIREWLMKTSFKGLTVKLNDGTSTDTMEATTTSTTVKATAHGLITGDYIVNRTRSNAVREITYVDANTFTVSAVTGQTSGDSFSLFVSQTVGIEGLDVETSFDYVSNYTEKSIRSSSSEPTLIAGQFLLFSYNEVIPILVQRTDNVSIALMKSTLGYTDGIFDGQPITDKTIKTRSEASKMAESIINKYSNVIITAQFATNQEGLESGQIITIQDSGVTERNINQSFVIQSVRSRQLAWGENRYTVTCSSLLFGMLELLQQILASRRKVNVDENEAINNIENANETITISDSTLVNSNQDIEMETITISDTTVANAITPPYLWGDTGGGPQEFRWNLSSWN